MASTTYITADFAIRNIGDRSTDSGVTSGVDDYSAEEDRFANIYYEGVVSPDNAFAAEVVGGDNPWVLRIGSGAAKSDVYIIEGTEAGQGRYRVRLEDATVDVEFDAAEAGTTRIDEVYVVVRDAAYDAGNLSLPMLAYRKGDPGGSAPGPDGQWTAYALLYQYTHPAGATALDAVNLADMRGWAHVEHAWPAGIIVPHAGNLAPRGFLHAAGQAVSRSQYARLFAAIGTRWGEGDGSTTFNLPDARLRYIYGSGGGEGGVATGEVFGVESVTLSVANMPAHSHSISSNTHSHPQNVSAATGSVPGVQRRDYDSDGPGGVFPQGISTQLHTHSHTIGQSGSGQPFSILPRSIGARYIISI